ncbi:hypothetical protein [Aeromonas veronii]|uniref:hypothetical protein n=1 Tax=Aeromonas veronii TaxID=654 RepID=UPI00111750CE|nr:hypothetical protein [Aeromonas veronii]
MSSILSTLQNISAAVFTIAGIWIAYIYPEAISSFTNPDKIALLKGTESTEQVKSLVFTVITSASVLTCTLLFSLAAFLYKNSDIVVANKSFFVFISTTLVVYLSLNQTKAILGVILNTLRFVSKLFYLKTEREVNDDL